MTEPLIVDGVLYGADELVAEWVSRKLGGKPPGDRPYVALGLTDGERLLGGMVFFNHRPGAEVYFTVATDGPEAVLRRKALARMYAYAFKQLGVRRITAEIDMRNTRSIRLAEGVGFVREGAKRKAASDGGSVGVFGLLLKDFKLKRYMPHG